MSPCSKFFYLTVLLNCSPKRVALSMRKGLKKPGRSTLLLIVVSFDKDLTLQNFSAFVLSLLNRRPLLVQDRRNEP